MPTRPEFWLAVRRLAIVLADETSASWHCDELRTWQEISAAARVAYARRAEALARTVARFWGASPHSLTSLTDDPLPLHGGTGLKR